MAMYHLRVKYVKRSAGRSSVAAAAYRSSERLTDEREGKTHDYTRKSDIEYSEILLPEHMPEELHNRAALWNAVETGIKRKDGQPAFEVEVALPRELSHDQCAQLAREFAQEHFVAKGLPVDLNIHRPIASDGGEHPHCHMLISTRRFHPDGTLAKTATDLQDNPALVRRVYALEEEGKIDEAVILQRGTNLGQWREAWADYSNRFLDSAGSDARIDHRTLAAQEIDREPAPNIGFAIYDRLKEFKGHLAERVERWQKINIAEGVHDKLQQQFSHIRENYPQMQAEFVARAREYGQKFWPDLNKEPQLDRGQEHER